MSGKLRKTMKDYVNICTMMLCTCAAVFTKKSEPVTYLTLINSTGLTEVPIQIYMSSWNFWITRVNFITLTKNNTFSILSSDSILTRLQAGWPGFNSWKRQWRYLSLHHHIQTSARAHPASYVVSTGGSSLMVKQLQHETNHSNPCST